MPVVRELRWSYRRLLPSSHQSLRLTLHSDLVVPECESYTDVYRTYGLLHERAYFAHCCHCGTDEQQLLKLHDTGYVSYPFIKTCRCRMACSTRGRPCRLPLRLSLLL